MRGRLILVEGGPSSPSGLTGVRAALLVDGRLEGIEIDPPNGPSQVGAALSVRVERHASGLGTIVRLPDGGEALLDRAGPLPAAGDDMPVQVTRDARGGKMQGVTRNIALSGRALVHLPLGSGVHISRRLSGDLRTTLPDMLAGKPGGWIIRGNAARMDPSDMSAEIAALTDEAAHLGGPAYQPPDSIRRLLTDYGAPAPDRIVVGGRKVEAMVVAWCQAFAPSLLSRIERTDGSPFDLHDVDGALAELAASHAALPAGGSLVIERTEALTAIDVNAGAETNALTTNLAAAGEIARQLRLRHIGGIVVIDFISMTRPADRERVQDALKAALADDPSRTHLLPMSALGLIEMTRERRGPGLSLSELAL